MIRFIAGRLLSLVPVVLGVSFVAFLVLQLSPGDPAQLMLGENATAEGVAQLRREYALDQPLPIQFGAFLLAALHGDFGRSFATRTAVAPELLRRFGNTVELASLAFGLALLLGVPLGIVAAVRRNSLFDHAIRLVVLVFVSVPVFWLGILLIYLFAVTLRWLPSTGHDKLESFVLPTLSLSAYSLAILVRMTRASMLEVLAQDYLRTARAKGLRQRVVITRHAFKNALIPIITITGLQVGFLMTGAVLVETVFAWPGIGRYLVDALFGRDYPVIRACIFLFSVIFLLVNLVVDLLYAVIDPRIRMSG
ncbi:MAG TPA: ABC transporter permease [Candidatus Limnocylindria bacterium]|nr:ABC transporter permease [Candidatus Limnocylindria bacterium]